MTREEALKLLDENPVCEIHLERKRRTGYPQRPWQCESCSRERFHREWEEYRRKDSEIIEAAKMIYGIPKGSKKRTFWDKLFGTWNSDGGGVNG